MKEIHSLTKRTQHVVGVPNLVELQLDSYRWFLEEGLRELFESFSPITDFTGNHSIELVDFTLGEPKYDLSECRARDATLESPIKAKVRLRSASGDVIESDVYLGDLPLMTDKGTFIINGAERVVVSQLARSSGIYFKDNLDLSGRQLYNATLIPNEGAWIDIETDANDVITVRIGQTRKFPITTLLRALNLFPQATPSGAIKVSYKELPGKKLAEDIVDQATGEVLLESETVMSTREMRLIEKAALPQEFLVELPATMADSNADILTLFGDPETVDLPSRETIFADFRTEIEVREFNEDGTPARKNDGSYTSAKPRRRTPYALTDIRDKNNKIVVAAYTKIDRESARKIEALALDTIELLYVHNYVSGTLDMDANVVSKESALIDIYKKIRPSDPATPESSSSLMKSIFFDARRYDLAKVGRHKLNKKLGLSLPLSVRNITREDVIAIIRYIIKLASSDPDATVDDIDHLENKRVRSVGELLYSQLRLGFLRMEKVAKERMTSMDTDNILPQVVLSVKPISASIKSFFGSSQLSQFMDQTNPLAELGHKRRLSALGPGGLSRQSAKLEVRDVHHSHYGRICPIETPEGPNIGLIGQLTVHARVDEFGFIETPYRRVIEGVVQNDIDWLPADGEHHFKIAPANARLGEGNRFVDDPVQVRNNNEYPLFPAREVDYMDVAPQQLVSVATAIIPFLENDDANRALMGANMQRQAVPTLRPQAPLVKTGMEKKAARDSGAVIMAEREGTVVRVTAEDIIIRTDDDEADTYRLMNMIRSNQGTCVTQRPVVSLGQRVKQGDVLADGPCTQYGELALGQNILVAFVPWNGYNFEDAILLSQRLVKDDVYTSIHIERHEVEARDTKLGPEEITRDIPNVGEDALKDLDENGIIRIGAEVRPEDILVGRVAPKGQSELTAEERLIIAIFGKKAEETRDVSLRVPHGEKGKIVDVKVFSRYKYRDKTGRIYNFSKRPDSLTSDDWDGELERLPADELSAGVNMLVRVYTAQKRKIMEGDKMAGRHGNKGVVSKILPEEDMPFLPDGTPVDIVLNPLGVPSRMNIGQVLETHLGLVGKALNCSFVNPIFEGSTEQEILSEVDRYAQHVRKELLIKYVTQELKIDLNAKSKDTLDILYGKLLTAIEDLTPLRREQIAAMVAAPPAIILPDDGFLPEDEEGYEPVAVDNYDTIQIVENIKRNVVHRGGVDHRTGKFRLRDGLTGEYFQQNVTVGHVYMLKLAHLVDDKIHARSTGPYSLVTQQPLGGKAQFGGQRFGEMEVWALEAYGAAYTLQEILTIKSDDVLGRVKTYEAIVKGEAMLEPGVPESFKILVNELQSLGLKVTVEDEADREIDLKDREDDYEDTRGGMRFGGRAGVTGGGQGAAPTSNSSAGAALLAKRGFTQSVARPSATEEVLISD